MVGIDQDRLAFFIHAIEDLEVLELRNVLGDRIVWQPLALLIEDHHGDARDRLGHRVVAKDCVLRHGRMRFEIALAISPVVDDLAMPQQGW